MDMKLLQHSGITVIALSGRFDAYGAPQVDKAIKQAVEQGTATIVVDLSSVHFIDSTGLATLVQGMKRCRAHKGDLSLCALQAAVQVIVELTRLDKVFTLFSSQDEALRRFNYEYQSSTNHIA